MSDKEREAVLVNIVALAEELNRQVQNLRRFVAILQSMDGSTVAGSNNGASVHG